MTINKLEVCHDDGNDSEDVRPKEDESIDPEISDVMKILRRSSKGKPTNGVFPMRDYDHNGHPRDKV